MGNDNISVKLAKIESAKSAIKSVVSPKLGYDIGDNITQYADKMSDLNLSIISGSKNVDRLGVWHRPDDWDDIESMNIPEGNSEVYLLYANHIGTGCSFCRLRVYGEGTMSWSRGRVSNGVFTPATSYVTLSNGGYVDIDLESLEDDYSVVHIRSTVSITQCYTTGRTYDAKYNSCLMRYGRMPKGTNISFQCYYLESDNIMDFAKELSNTALSMANAYYYNMNMARWRHSGWNVTGNYTASLNAFFQQCYCLVDTDELDFSYWVTSKTTNVGAMFYQCYSLNKDINVTGWDLTNITTLSGTFYLCRCVRRIIGLTTWNEAPKCTTTSGMFYYNISFCEDVDLSALKVGNGTGNYDNASYMFTGSGIRNVNLSGWNFSKMTNYFSYMFSSMSGCETINLSGCVFPTASTTFCQMFYNCYKLREVVLDGWDFSHIADGSTTAMQYFLYGCPLLERVVARNCVPLSGMTYKDTSSSYGYLFYNNYSLRYLDASWIDMSIFTGTYTHNYGFRNLFGLVDFIPPLNISKSFYIGTSPLLSHESLLRVINNLVDHSGDTGTFTLTIGTINKNKLTTTEQAMITSKGWTIA